MKRLYLLLQLDADQRTDCARDEMLTLLKHHGLSPPFRAAMLDDAVSAGAHLKREALAGLPDLVISADVSDAADVDSLLAAISALNHDFNACITQERVVMDPPIDDNGRIAGSMQFCSFRKIGSLSHDAFMRIWREDHTQVAIDCQSTFGYRQHEVLEWLRGELNADAIVEEHFPLTALSDPTEMFGAIGDPAAMQSNLKHIIDSCDRFIDKQTVNVIHMSEYQYNES